jgi:hypothetical protein
MTAHLQQEEEEGLLLVGRKGHDEDASVHQQGRSARDDRPHFSVILHQAQLVRHINVPTHPLQAHLLP